jgi:hypothetical protein
MLCLWIIILIVDVFGRYLIWVDVGLPTFYGGGGSVVISLCPSRLEMA